MSSTISDKVFLKNRNNKYRTYPRTKRMASILTILPTIISLIACRPSISQTTTPVIAPTSTQRIVVTAMTAQLMGRLEVVNGCLRVRNEKYDADYALVWPPDTSMTIEGEQVEVVTGIISGNRNEIILRLGDWVLLSGGETRELSDDLSQTLPSNCQGPFWVVGFQFDRFNPSDE
jgi:hypothetical protein